MRRLARHVFTIIAALSLLLSVAVCVLWVLSHYRDYDTRTFTKSGDAYELAASQGSVIVMCSFTNVVNEPITPPYGILDNVIRPLPVTKHHPLPGVEWKTAFIPFKSGPRIAGRDIRIHCGVLVLAFLVAPVCRVPRLLRWARERGRTAQGLCPACGYDLRATTDRCPECGTRAALR